MRTKKRTKASSIVMLIISILLIGAFSVIGILGTPDIGGYRVQSFGEVIKRGLDLQGGVSILLEATAESNDESAVDRTIVVLEQRINNLGVSETVIAKEGTNRIRIEIPGRYDSNDIVQTLSKAGKLTFVGPDGTEVLTGSDVKDAAVMMDNLNRPVVSLKLNNSGKQKFADATKKYLGQSISIKMDDEVVSAPVVEAHITDGEASITGQASVEEAEKLASIIKSGALPVVLKNVETNTVGPTIGDAAIPQSLKAGAIGIILVFLFMLIFYRVPGLLATLALTVFILLVLLAFVVFDVVLTLPGIAGLLLTIGMAVDANVLVFERIKEELKLGKSPRSAVDLGFNRAMSSILDSNITTIIAAATLLIIGTGGVKGFGLTLLIGVSISMFTAIVVTKRLLKLALNAGILSKPSYFGVKRG
ncbi:MAG: protein translocase subunit SecD [Clostridiales bacterium]|mgnify:CR=1 FL=1|nr:protein translocase subunit SecD [Clostridiales bacterium]